MIAPKRSAPNRSLFCNDLKLTRQFFGVRRVQIHLKCNGFVRRFFNDYVQNQSYVSDFGAC